MNPRMAAAMLLALVLCAAPGLSAAPSALHPLVTALDDDGARVADSGGDFSEAKSCGLCHDTGFIQEHNTHEGVECHACHSLKAWEITTDMLDDQGRLKREFTDISAPTPGRCGACHGLADLSPSPLSLPDGYDRTRTSVASDDNPLTKGTGVIFSGQNMDRSHLNLQGKDDLNRPFDIHAARLVSCTDCHRPANHPARFRQEAAPAHLKHDPRGESIGAYLVRPDHRLATVACTRCHEPLAVHDDLPYPGRHMEKVACTACHVARTFGPTAMSVNASLVTPEGGAVVSYRNQQMDPDIPASARYTTAFSPALLPVDDGGGDVLSPLNLVTRIAWQDGATAVPLSTVARALQDGGAYRPAVVAALDNDGDGRLTAGELVLDTELKVALVAGLLGEQGVEKPVLTATVEHVPLHHGVQEHGGATMACDRCHGAQSSLGAPVKLALGLPPGLVPTLPDRGPLARGRVAVTRGVAWFTPPASTPGSYVLGYSRAPWSDNLGFLLFVLSFAGIAAHGAVRLATRKKRAAGHGPTRRAYLYTLYQRLWHWLMALSILLLLLTGLEIHFAGRFSLLGLAAAVALHNGVAAVLIINAGLSFFYHLATTDIRAFIPKRDTLVRDVASQAMFYLHGIFVGAPHPVPRTKQRPLNPLQQLTYLMLLNVLIPFQVLSGAAMWVTGSWPSLAADLPGLHLLAPLHNLGSWALLSFVVVHGYLITTGHSLCSNLRAMVTGYDVLDADDGDAKGGGRV